MTNWISHSIVIPLFPILVAILITVLKGEGFQYQTIFGGTELYMLSVIVLASTRNDVENSPVDFSNSGFYRRLVTVLIPAMIFCSIVYGIIFMNVRAQEPDISEISIANLGIAIGMVSLLLCTVLQFKIKRKIIEEVPS